MSGARANSAWRELSLLRIIALGLAGPKAATPADVVARLGCLQAQDLSGVLESVALRTVSADVDEAGAALDAGTVVRSWPMRSTLHLVAPRNLGWMLALTRARMESRLTARHRQLGIDAAMVDRAGEVALEALSQRETLSRADLLSLWEPEGVTAVRQRGPHLIMSLSIRGLIVQGPRHPSRVAEQLFVRTSRWIPDPLPLGRADALATWVGTYLRSHGPAPVEEFARWTGLSPADARLGLAAVESTLAPLDMDGRRYWMAPETPDLLAAHRKEAEAVLLLPGFDELLLGYRDRSATLPTAQADQIAPGGNGMFRPTVVDRGQVVGKWAWTGRNGYWRIKAEPFTQFTVRQQRGIERQADVRRRPIARGHSGG